MGMRWTYVVRLAAIMAVFTFLALFIIRISYHNLFGPDSDPYGAYKHFAIDFFGMTVHVAIAALIVWSTRPLFRMSHPATMQAEQSDARKSPVGREIKS
ncbi:hypothetical protein E3A20_14370 [Planctomyces bekefii]|uniref:Uncharacterized protein n=1 Tax=Planctomyces bekefii TaxID=1653850 RepID=A0A5C6M8S6_9PLAN|nr:hypothetical protein E3A20_14370 [Planctomyces bekefii]